MFYRRARVPFVCLPPAFHSAPSSEWEPWREVDIEVQGDRIVGVTPSAGATGGVDLAGELVFPGLVDCHTHLDKTHTWNRAPNPRGEFWDALSILHADSTHWDEADVYRRATIALQSAWAHGTVAVRTHLDAGGTRGEAAFAVMDRLREEWAGRVTLQTVALCSLQSFADGAADSVMKMSDRHRASALGGFPQPNPDLPAQLDYLMAVAKELGVGLDLHVDESGLVHAECLRATAEAVLRNGFPHPVACGHDCSLAVQDPARAGSTLDLVRDAGIRLISLPLCNLYLQGRGYLAGGSRPATPRWRGVTLAHEALERGIPVACASDNVRDAFYAWGDYDLLEVMRESVRIIHLDTRMASAAAAVSVTAADVMGLPDHGRIVPGARAALVATGATGFNTLLARPASRRRIIVGESILTPDLPALPA